MDVNAQTHDGYGKTALYYAVKDGYAEIVKLLLKHEEIKVNGNHYPGKTEPHGETVLIFAAYMGYEKIVELLLKHGVNTEDGNVTLRYAIINNQKEIIFLLLIHSTTLDEDSESKINEKPELKECLIVLKEIKKMPHLGKLIETSKNIEGNTDVILGFINDKDKQQGLIKEFKSIKKKHPCERLLFMLEYLWNFIKHIFLKFFTNKKVMATQLHESKDGIILENLPYEAAEKIVSYFDADTNKAVSLVLSKKVDAFLTRLKEVALGIPEGSLTKVATESIKSSTECCVI